MAKVELTLPAMGEGVIEATITKWLVNVGDQVNEDDSLVEVATDKVDSEIPSPYSGTIREIKFKEGDVPQVGQVIAILETEQAADSPDTAAVKQEVDRIRAEAPEKEPTTDEKGKEGEESGKEEKEEAVVPDGEAMDSRTPAGRFLTPLVRSIAREEGLSREELDTIPGSGKNHRITKEDVLQYLGQKKAGSTSQAASPTQKQTGTQVSPRTPAPSPAVSPNDEIVEMDRMRKLIAEHMVYSKQTSPHVTSFIEVDMTGVVEWRNRVKDEFQKREGQKITFMPIFIEAAARALRDYPMINVSVDGTRIIKKKRINIGMATALPNGNLIVPVIKDADEKNLIGLAKSVNDLANRARNNQLKPDEISGGTFTITNFGTFDSITGTPIINQPEVAILGVGAIRKKPAVIETPSGDAIAIRHLMVLSLAYDHRVVDGALGGMYLKRVAEYLENFDINRVP